MKLEEMEDRIKLQLDGNKMFHHLDRVEDWLDGKTIYPIYVAFSPSSLCNHKCEFCVYHYKEFEPIYFPKDRYFKLVDEWSRLGVKSIFYAGDGEPLLNKDSIEMIEYTRKAGIDIAMNTNGRLMLPKSNQVLVDSLDWIRISLNAGSSENYAKIHGTNGKDFDVVLENLKDLVAKKKASNSAITIGVQCVLLEENHHEIESLAHTLKAIGVDYFAVKPFLKHPWIKYSNEVKNKVTVLKDLEKIKSISDDNFQFMLRAANFEPQNGERSYKKCLSGQFMIEVDARGDVYSCGPYIGDKKHCYGNVLEESFEEMWNSERCRKVMDYIQNHLDVSKCMPNCRPNSVNKFLWELKNPPQHVNFI